MQSDPRNSMPLATMEISWASRTAFRQGGTQKRGSPSGPPRRDHRLRFPWLVTIVLVSLVLGNCSAGRPERSADIGGFAALRSGDYQKARQLFEASLQSNPEDAVSQGGLLATLRETGEYAAALELTGKYLAGQKTPPAVLLEAGRLAVSVGRFEEAEKHLRQALSSATAREGDARLEIERELAELLEFTGRTREAAEIWERIIDRYRSGAAKDSRGLGAVAVAAWRMDYVQDAKDIFMDATDEKIAGEIALETLADFGYLFLEKYNATDAISCFRDCLKINPNYPAALAGMAQAKLYESNAEAENYARAALQHNPNFVPAINLIAELKFQEEAYEAGLEGVRRALAVNPRDLGTLSLEAVYHQARGDNARYRAVEKKILQINPVHGELYFTLAENLVMRRKYGEAVELYRKAVALDPRLWPACAGLGINLMRIGELAEGRRMIERAFAGDPFNVWAFNTLDLLDQMEKFARIESRNFVFLVSRQDEPVIIPYLERLAEEAYASLSTRYRFQPGGPLQVEVFPDHGGFAVRTLGLPGLGALGVCFGRVVAMDSPRARPEGSFNWGATLWHEFAHVVTLQMTRHNIPRWYSEGLSVYEERRARPGWGDDLSAGFIRAYKEGKLLKVREFNSGLMRPKFPEQIAYTYYQASLFCEMIEEKFGFEKIRQSLLLFAENKSAGEVFLEVLGWDGAAMEAEYSRFLESRLQGPAKRLDFGWASRQREAAPPGWDDLAAAIARNPDDFFAHWQMGLLLLKGGSKNAAETHLKKAQSLFPEFVEPGNPYQVLSEMYLEAGREEEALAQLLSWTRYDENSPQPLVQAAEIYRKRKDWANAARVSEKSVYAYPFLEQAHQMLGEAAAEIGEWATAVAAYRALVGLNPPDMAGAYYNLARAWLGSGNRQEARRAVLRALEIAPSFEKAQQLLLQLRAIGR